MTVINSQFQDVLLIDTRWYRLPFDIADDTGTYFEITPLPLDFDC